MSALSGESSVRPPRQGDNGSVIQKIGKFVFGNDPTHPAISPNFENLEASSVFTIKELKRLFARYVELCDPINGDMSIAHFMHQPELVHCPFARLCFDHESAKSLHGTISFTQYVRILSKLSLKTLPTEKVQYLCEVSGTSLSGDRFDKDDLRALLISLNGTPLSDELLQPLIDNAWSNMEKQVKQGRRKQKKKEQLRDDDEHSEVSTDAGRPYSAGSEVEEESVDLTKGELTTFLCSLDLQNFLTVMF